MSDKLRKAIDEAKQLRPHKRGIDPGHPNTSVLRLAFWEAMRRCDADDRIHAVDTPCFNRVDRDGGDQLIDGHLPDEVWEHMATAIQELRAAAGLADR